MHIQIYWNKISRQRAESTEKLTKFWWCTNLVSSVRGGEYVLWISPTMIGYVSIICYSLTGITQARISNLSRLHMIRKVLVSLARPCQYLLDKHVGNSYWFHNRQKVSMHIIQSTDIAINMIIMRCWGLEDYQPCEDAPFPNCKWQAVNDLARYL